MELDVVGMFYKLDQIQYKKLLCLMKKHSDINKPSLLAENKFGLSFVNF